MDTQTRSHSQHPSPLNRTRTLTESETRTRKETGRDTNTDTETGKLSLGSGCCSRKPFVVHMSRRTRCCLLLQSGCGVREKSSIGGKNTSQSSVPEPRLTSGSVPGRNTPLVSARAPRSYPPPRPPPWRRQGSCPLQRWCSSGAPPQAASGLPDMRQCCPAMEPSRKHHHKLKTKPPVPAICKSEERCLSMRMHVKRTTQRTSPLPSHVDVRGATSEKPSPTSVATPSRNVTVPFPLLKAWSCNFVQLQDCLQGHEEMFAPSFPEQGKYSFAPAEILDSNICLTFSPMSLLMGHSL